MRINTLIVKIYNPPIDNLMLLSYSARIVLDCVLQLMDTKGFVENNAYFKEYINTKAIRVGKEFSDNTVNKAFTELSRSCFIEKTKRRGLYVANPAFFNK